MKNNEITIEREALKLLVMFSKYYAEMAQTVDPAAASKMYEGIEWAEIVLTNHINTDWENYQ
jgi:hypothetical protein